MALINIITDLHALVQTMNRIADALDRLAPAPRTRSSTGPGPSAVGAFGAKAPDAPSQPSMSESPEEYDARTSWERQFAFDMGLAPDNPHVLELLRLMRDEALRMQLEHDAQANPDRDLAATEAEAFDAVRAAFREAIAEANTR
jgi:hypothetical protein